MKIGFIGLGKMGRNMVLSMLEKGVDVVIYNRTREKTDELISNFKFQISNPQLKTQNSSNLYPSYSIKELISKLEKPRIVWLMVPAGEPVDEIIDELLAAGVMKNDIVIDGGNSFYKDSIRRSQKLTKRGIHFMDIGTSGGLEGARNGACLMVGGEEEIFKKIKPTLEAIATDGGVGYFGSSGAGHFVKMVHNGVEYGMLEAIGEGFEILEKGPYKLNLARVAYNWTRGSVVRGWLMDLLVRALRKDPKLSTVTGAVGSGETGEWTIQTAKDQDVETPAINAAVDARRKTLKKPTFAGRVIQALRWEFGRHR